MTPGIQVVQGIEDQIEAGEPIDVELRILDIGVMCFKLDLWIESTGTLFGDLRSSQYRFPPCLWSSGRTRAFDFLMCS